MNTIETIRAEIERLKAKYRKDMYKSNHEGLASGYKIEAYNELLSFLDTLEEEPVEVKFKPGMKNVLDALRPCNSEKPNTPEGLDEAAEEYLQNVKAHFLRTLEHPTAKDAFKAGAEWAFGQGVTFISPIDYDNDGYFLDSFEQQAAAINRLGVKVMDKVIVQIRNKED